MGTMTDATARVRADRDEKLGRIRDLLDEIGAPAIQLTSAESLSWLFGGARVTVPVGGPPVLSALVDRDGVVVHVHANELDRLRDEELHDQDAQLIAVPWHEPLPRAAGAAQEADHDAAVRRLRAPLTPADVARYRALGADAARAVTPVLAAAHTHDSELALAAELARAVVAIGADPVVLLVAGRSRREVRHPLPTAARLGPRVMAVVGARRGGLFANLTRWLAFEPDPSSEDLDARLREVEADAFAATRPGRTLGGALHEIAQSYVRHGFAADAWLGHHQGGPTGYLGRDPRASAGSREEIVAGRAFAWNPSVPGAKIEDTVLLGDHGIEVLTLDPAWPTTTVQGLERPVPLAVAP